MESELEKPVSGLESRGPTLHQSENSASKGEEANPSPGLVFNVLGRANQSHERETGLQSIEQKKETSPLIENRSHNAEGKYPTGMLNDDRFKDVLKRLGLAI